MKIAVKPPGTCPCQIISQTSTVTTISHPGTSCPCEILYQVQSGQVVIDSLTSGEEYFVTVRVSSFYGLESSPTFIVQSLPTAPVVYSRNIMSGNEARFEFNFGDGVGSYIRIVYKDIGLQGETNLEDYVISYRFVVFFSFNFQFSLFFETSYPPL